MPNIVKQMLVRELTDAFKGAEGLVIVSLSGLSVEESEKLRDSLAEHGLGLQVVRNRLAKLALQEIGLEAPAELFRGNVAVVCGDTEDAIRAAKILQDSDARKSGKVALRGGLLEGSLLDERKAFGLTKLPGKRELHSMLLGAISGPARKLVGLLAAPQGALVRVIQARVDAAGS
ncbi:MAG: 50S ribosomal protein L10 [Planctomycetota bacterium]